MADCSLNPSQQLEKHAELACVHLKSRQDGTMEKGLRCDCVPFGGVVLSPFLLLKSQMCPVAIKNYLVFPKYTMSR